MSKIAFKKIENIRTMFFMGLSFIFTLTSPSSFAENMNVYAGLGIANIAASEQDIDSSKAGFRLIGGYTFNKYIAAEVALFNIGDHTKLGMKGNGFSLSVLGQYPVVDHLNVFAELGGMIVDLEIDESNTTIDQSGDESLQDGNDPGSFIAFGVAYDVNDWSLVLKMAEVDTDADLTIVSLNFYHHY